MKMYLHLLLATAIIAPLCAFGMDKAPDAALPTEAKSPIAQAATDLKEKATTALEKLEQTVEGVVNPNSKEKPSAEPAPQEAAASRGKHICNISRLEPTPVHVPQGTLAKFLGSPWNALRTLLLVPSVPVPTINEKNDVQDKKPIVTALKEQAIELAKYDKLINSQTTSSKNRIFTALASGVYLAGLYGLQNGMSLNTMPAVLTAMSFILTQWLAPKLNTYLHFSVLRQQTSGLHSTISKYNNARTHEKDKITLTEVADEIDLEMEAAQRAFISECHEKRKKTEEKIVFAAAKMGMNEMLDQHQKAITYIKRIIPTEKAKVAPHQGAH